MSNRADMELSKYQNLVAKIHDLGASKGEHGSTPPVEGYEDYIVTPSDTVVFLHSRDSTATESADESFESQASSDRKLLEIFLQMGVPNFKYAPLGALRYRNVLMV